MTDDMQTRNVFIDTSIFINHNYNYENSVFQNLIRLARDESAKVFVTDITIREVQSHLDSDVSKSIQAHSKFKSDARILRNIDISAIQTMFASIDEAASVASLRHQLDEFLNEVKATCLAISDVPAYAVFDRYFAQQPPFSEGKKKYEFPDAFVVEALERWCHSHSEMMYVISTDKDLQLCCASSDVLLSLTKLAQYIDIIEFHDQVLSPSIYSLVDNNRLTIEAAITDAFLLAGFWLEDQDGDVADVRVDDLRITDELLLDVAQEYAVVLLNVTTTFSADVTYDDYDTAIYDSEDKIAIPWQVIERTVQRTRDYTATITMSHNVDDPNFFEIDDVELDIGSGFGIYLDDYDEYD